MKRVRLSRPRAVIRSALLAVGATAALGVPAPAAPQVRHYPLVSTDDLRSQTNVAVEPAVLQGKKGLRVTMSGEGPQIVPILGLEFANGVIEAEIAGAPAPGAPEGARGFVGIAFRLHNDMKTYDAFYLRPTNGRAEDQERRNHAVQYISQPDWTWSRLRKETPSRYEAYADLTPAVWTKIKIDVRRERARLYVHDQEQPTLIVNDLKTGAEGKGGVALWLDQGTVAHFRNLTVEPASKDGARTWLGDPDVVCTNTSRHPRGSKRSILERQLLYARRLNVYALGGPCGAGQSLRMGPVDEGLAWRKDHGVRARLRQRAPGRYVCDLGLIRLSRGKATGRRGVQLPRPTAIGFLIQPFAHRRITPSHC